MKYIPPKKSKADKSVEDRHKELVKSVVDSILKGMGKWQPPKKK